MTRTGPSFQVGAKAHAHFGEKVVQIEIESRDAGQIRREREGYALPHSVFPEDDKELRRLLEALNFIPAVEVAAKREARSGALLSCARLTLLNLAIQVVCDDASSGRQDTWRLYHVA